MVLLDLLGRKQTLRILWELKDEPATFRALQERCGGISPSILNRRIAEMRSAGMIVHQPSLGYTLTSEGSELLLMLRPLRTWAEKWEKRIESPDVRADG